MIERLTSRASVFIKMATFGAGVITMAVGGHRLADQYLDPEPAYVIFSAEVVLATNGKKSTVIIDVTKQRPECSRTSADIFISFKNGTGKGHPLDMGGHLTPGRHLVEATFDGPSLWDVDLTKRPVLQTKHDCGEGQPIPVAFCEGFYAGAEKTVCSNEE